MPAGMPTSSEMISETMPSSIVAGNRSRIISLMGLARTIGVTEVAGNQIFRKTNELCGDWIVQAERVPKASLVFQRSLLSDHLSDRVADETEQRKGNQTDRQHHEDGLQDPSGDENQHVSAHVAAVQPAMTAALPFKPAFEGPLIWCTIVTSTSTRCGTYSPGPQDSSCVVHWQWPDPDGPMRPPMP